MSDADCECVFCGTAQIRSSITDYGDVIAFEPLDPVAPGHLLVVPKAHVEHFAEYPAVSGRAMKVAAEIAAERGGDFNLITSKGAAATQTVKHLHLHLVPRRPHDGLSLPWTA